MCDSPSWNLSSWKHLILERPGFFGVTHTLLVSNSDTHWLARIWAFCILHFGIVTKGIPSQLAKFKLPSFLSIPEPLHPSLVYSAWTLLDHGLIYRSLVQAAAESVFSWLRMFFSPSASPPNHQITRIRITRIWSAVIGTHKHTHGGRERERKEKAGLQTSRPQETRCVSTSCSWASLQERSPLPL